MTVPWFGALTAFLQFSLCIGHLLEGVQILTIACRPCIRREFCTKDV
jgi:hypothetical protein